MGQRKIKQERIKCPMCGVVFDEEDIIVISPFKESIMVNADSTTESPDSTTLDTIWEENPWVLD